MTFKHIRILLPALALLSLPSCGKKETAKVIDCTAEFQAFLKDAKNENGEQWIYLKTPADVPKDLKWENGAEQKEFGSPNAKKGGTYHFYLNDYPRTLRHVGPDANNHIRPYVLDYFYMTMLNRHPDTLEPIPGIAKEWAQASDGKTFYFHMDPDARFSDGEKIRADNVLFCLYVLTSPHMKDPWSPAQYKKKIASVTKYDDLTMSVTLVDAKPDASYHAGSMLYPYPMGFYKEFGDDAVERYNWRFVPTPGAYEIKESGLKKGQSVTLTHVKDWWAKDKRFYRQLFNPDRIVLDIIRDPDKIVEVFKGGEIDALRIRVPELWHKRVANDDPLVAKGYVEKVTFYNQAPRPTYGFSLNTSHPPLDNHDVREGLQHSCNWDLVIKQVFYGDGERLPNYSDGYDEFTNPNVQARPFDTAKAAEFFAKAGYTERGPDGIFRNAKGQRLSFTLTNSYKVLESALVVIKEEAKKAGVEFNLESPEQTAAWKKYNERKHDIAFSALNISVEMYPRFWDMFHSANAYNTDGSIKTDTNNFTMTNDKELDAMIDTYDHLSNKAEMIALSYKIQQRIHDNAAFIPAFKQPWYRMAKWRWLHYPEHFDSKTSRDQEETWAFWVDDEERQATQDAMKSGKTFPPSVKTYDQWRSK